MTRKRKRTGKPSRMWVFLVLLWTLLRVVSGSLLLIPAALIMGLSYILLPADVWNWYKSWIGSGEAPAKLPKPKPVADEFPAPHYVPIHTETEINESQRDRGETGTGHP